MKPHKPLIVPLREASWALARALESRQSFVVHGDDATNRWLPREPGVLRGLVDHVVGAALRYDAEHRTALVASALVWMECDRHTEDAARELHVHPNTLRYRLRRFRTLTVRELTSTADLAEVWLALRAPARCAQSRPRGLTPCAAAAAPFSKAASGSCAPRAASDSHATCSRPRSSTVSWKTSGRL